MCPMQKLLFFPLLMLVCAVAAFSQGFPYQEYDPRTLAELVDNGASAMLTNTSNKQMMIDAKPFYSAIRVRYVGTSRPLPAEKRDLIEMYQKSMQTNIEITKFLDSEYLFRECDKEYWIPVQKQFAAYFPKELKPGDTITIYMMVIGGLKLDPKGPYEPIFLVNEFRKYE
jgi:hypothetical protein